MKLWMVGGSKQHSHEVKELTSHRKKKVSSHIKNLSVIKGVLKCILNFNDRQCRKAKTGVMCHCRLGSGMFNKEAKKS